MRKKLTSLGKSLSPYVVGTEGNISGRTSGGFIIKASGYQMNDLQDKLVACDVGYCADDECATYPLGSLKPSMESDFHAWIYENSDTEIIAHTHPVNVLKILCSPAEVRWRFAVKRLFPDQVVFNGAEYCVVPYATPGKELTKAIAYAAREYEAQHKSFPKVFLLQNHGIICCAKTCKEALIMTQICEKSAEIFLGTQPHKLIPLSLSDVEALQVNKDEKYRKELL
jgi:ribulose-5-phosphate 4-epimerase/fuculose-1-phosphate aldolase